MAAGITRRKVLIGAGSIAVTGIAATAGLAILGPKIADWVTDRSVTKTDHVNPLRMPPLDEGNRQNGITRYEAYLKTGSTRFLDGQETPTWGINGDFLGPTLRMHRGDTVQMTVRNELPQASSLHWHGMHLPPEMDGGPHQPIESGGRWEPTWVVDQPAATLWYHPHPHGETADHVWRGLAGMIIVEDDEPVILPSDYGVDDIPLIIQDRRFDDDGEFEEREYAFGYFGNRIMVNGTIGARFDVSHETMRFRLLNGSNTRWYHLAFSDDRPFKLIATDSGYVSDPAPELTSLLLSPGERAEIAVEFAPGDDVMLKNVSASQWKLSDYGTDQDFDVIRFVGGPELQARVEIALPTRNEPDDSVVSGTRNFTLNGHNSINDAEMDMKRIDEVVTSGATEIWEVRATDFASHNFHIHGVTFEVLEVNGETPPTAMRGPKDTAQVPKGKTVSLLVRFPRYTNEHFPYMYHCHVLRHEDQGMMGQFLVVEPGREDDVDTTLDTNHQH